MNRDAVIREGLIECAAVNLQRAAEALEAGKLDAAQAALSIAKVQLKEALAYV